jgi:hypothetical protein
MREQTTTAHPLEEEAAGNRPPRRVPLLEADPTIQAVDLGEGAAQWWIEREREGWSQESRQSQNETRRDGPT